MIRCLSVGLTSPSGSGDQVGEGLLSLLPATGLKTTVRVDDEKVGGKDLEHVGNSVLDLLLSRNTGRVDVVDTGSDLVGVAVRLEDVEQLEVGLGSLDGDDIRVKGLDGREDVSEVGVTEVGVDLDVVGDTRGGKSERVDGPLEVRVPIGLSEGKTLSDSRLIDLDGLDAGLGKVDNLVSESESELLGLNLLGDIGSGERPVEDGNRAGKHTLHWFVGKALGVSGPSDSHGLRSGNVGDNNWWSDVSGSVRLNPTELGEDEAGKLFTEVLNHVVSLGLTVDEEVKTGLLLEVDGVLDLSLHGLLVLLLGDLALAELGSGKTDLLGLGERSNGGGGELGEVKVLLLGRSSGGELGLSGELLLGDVGDTVSDGGVRGSLELSSGSNVLDVLLESGVVGAVEGSGEGGDLLALLLGESEPADLLGSKLGLDLQRDRGVEQRRRGGHNNTVGTKLLDGLLGESLGGLEVGLPNVSAGNDTELEVDLGVFEGGNGGLELSGLTVEVEVESVDGEVLEVLKGLADTTVSGSEGDLGGNRGEGLVNLLELRSPSLGSVSDQDGLVDLDVLNTSLLELGEELLVDGEQVVEERERLEVGRGLSGLGNKGKVGDRTEHDRSGGDTSLLGLVVLVQLLVDLQAESGGGTVLNLDNVVVGVEELAHLGGDNVNSLGLVLTTSAHGEVGVQVGQVLGCISLRDDTEVERVVKKLVIEGEVTAEKSASVPSAWKVRRGSTHDGMTSTPAFLMEFHRSDRTSLATFWRSSAEDLPAQ